MPTKGSREQDRIVDRARREMDGIEHEKNLSNPAGPHTCSAGAIGGGDQKGRRGRIASGREDARKSRDE